MTDVGDRVDGRGPDGKWPGGHPDFEPGNMAARTHGACSPRVVAPLAAKYLEHMAAVAPWTRGAAFAAQRESSAWAESQLHILRAWVDEHGLVDGEDVRPVVSYLDRLERRAAALRNDLGLTPQSMVKLLGSLSALGGEGGGVADGLEALKETGLAILEAAEQRTRDGAIPDGKMEAER